MSERTPHDVTSPQPSPNKIKNCPSLHFLCFRSGTDSLELQISKNNPKRHANRRLAHSNLDLNLIQIVAFEEIPALAEMTQTH